MKRIFIIFLIIFAHVFTSTLMSNELASDGLVIVYTEQPPTVTDTSGQLDQITTTTIDDSTNEATIPVELSIAKISDMDLQDPPATTERTSFDASNQTGTIEHILIDSNMVNGFEVKLQSTDSGAAGAHKFEYTGSDNEVGYSLKCTLAGDAGDFSANAGVCITQGTQTQTIEDAVLSIDLRLDQPEKLLHGGDEGTTVTNETITVILQDGQ
jgi:hypothetical protein